MVYGAPAGKLAGACVIHTKHGVNPDLARRVFLRKWAAKLVDGYVAVSVHTAEDALLSDQICVGKLRVIENGVDTELFHPRKDKPAIRREMGIDTRAVIGTVGRLNRVKNQAMLLRASAPLLRDGAGLLIAGDGPERGNLEELARELGIRQQVRFLGEFSDIPALLPAFDVFALTSDTEGLPLAVLEAMACGLPVVATAVGGVGTVVREGRTGYLVPAGDEIGIRDRISRLLSDNGLAEDYGQSARTRVVEDYSMDRTAREHMDFYWEALETSKPLHQPAFPY